MRRERISSTELDLKERVISVNRTAKVVKGGRRFGFNAIVVVGDGKGHVGCGLGKAREATDAISKGAENAKKNLIRIPILNGTLPHEVLGKYGAGRVFLKPASPGTGVIAGGAVRAIMESAGVHNVLSKSIGSANPHNVVKATVAALQKLMDAPTMARRRGMSVKDVFTRAMTGEALGVNNEQ